MASFEDVKALKPDQLKSLAEKHKVTIKEGVKHEDLAKTVSAVISPDDLAAFRKEQGLDKGDGQPKPTEVQSPQAPAPAPGTSVVVDKSAPGDNNIAELKSGDRVDEKQRVPSLSDQQPGDPKVKTQSKDGVVTERDAQLEDLENVEAPKGNKNKNEDEVHHGDDPGQVTEGDEVETVKLKNPSGRTVEVPEEHVVRNHMFAAGFELISGEEYSDEIRNEQEAYKARLKATAGLSVGNDTGDNGQSNLKADVERRKGSKDSDRVASHVEKKEDEAAARPSLDGTVGQVPAPVTGGRAAKALGK